MFFTTVATVALASAAAATSIPSKRDLIQPIPVRLVNYVPGPLTKRLIECCQCPGSGLRYQRHRVPHHWRVPIPVVL